MLNIGRLRADAPGYYLDAVAATRGDYYAGRGEAPGRWLGSLAPALGLAGPVERQAFERLLAGLHPGTGEVLVSAAGSNARARARAEGPAARRAGAGESLAPAQVAAQLGVSTRAVQHWLAAGEAARTAAVALDPAVALSDPEAVRAVLEAARAGRVDVDVPAAFLLGTRQHRTGGRGGSRAGRWEVSQAEVDRLRDARRPPDARAGWDVVLRPPKSYSVLWAVGGPEVAAELVGIHHGAVEAALAYLEDAAAAARTTAAVGRARKRVRTAAGGFVVAAFDHRDSRAGDPLLHTHCVIANATQLADGHWAGLDPAGLYRHGLAADAVYQAAFRHGAERRLGLASQEQRPGGGWPDVDGVPRVVVDAFSKRSEEIAAELERVGADSPAARQVAALATRAAKGLRAGDVELHRRWRDEAEGVGFGPRQVAACLGRRAGAKLAEADVEAAFERLAGPAGLTETAATFTRAAVVCALVEEVGGAVDGAGLVALADRFLASPAAVAVREHRPGRPRPRLLAGPGGDFVDHLADAAFTTPELAAMEQALMAAADASGGPTLGPAAVEAVLARRSTLSDEQAAMVRAVCGSDARLRAVVGYPGSGKTYATAAVVEALEAAGVRVIGCAVTAEAADELARGSGLVGRCDTVARTLVDLSDAEHGGLAPGSVVILDEASTASHRDLAALLAHVEAAGAALVLVGDPHQHSAVGPGNFFGWLVGRPGGAVATLVANQRQADVLDDTGAVVVSLATERAAICEFREGKVAESLARRDRAGLVTRAPTAAALYDLMAADWLAAWRGGHPDPLVATRNAVRAKLNARCRALLAAEGGLSGPVLEVDGTAFQAGDLVVARRNNRTLRARGHRGWWVHNGSRGRVVRVHQHAGEVEVDFAEAGGPQRVVRLPRRYVAAGFVEHAYAVTDYGVQGRTLTSCRSVLDDATTPAGAYVAGTRGRLENRIYLVDGTLPEGRDLDSSHGPPAERETGFDALAARLSSQAPPALLHEIDPRVADAAALAAAHSLGRLHAALAPLSAVLAAAPPDVTRRIAGAEVAAQRLAARRQLVAEQLRAGGVGRRRRAELAGEAAALGRSLAATNRRLADLRRAQADRDGYLADHAADVEAAAVLRQAVAGREARVRLAAGAAGSPALARALGPPGAGADHDRRRRRREAAEQAGLYLDRWGALPPAADVGDDAVAAVLGARPAHPDAAEAWEAAAAALADAGRAAARSPDIAADPVPVP
ncbi:MAG TPA: MobF family relaxase [Acidimicrobiales bacterium]|nr:MobF family relaxase [Acidimicrobiales bacterium]